MIQNFDELATNKYRKDLLEIVDAGYRSLDTDSVIRTNVKLNGDELKIKDKIFNLKDYKNVYVLGCGKVSCQAAVTLESILGDVIRSGVVIGIEKKICKNIKTYKGTHPTPSEINFEAGVRIEEIGNKATGDDLVVVIIGGGGSALLCPSQEESDQGKKLYDAFLSSGGDIHELNTVRKHISRLKGGGLAKILYPATVVGLIFSDIPGGDYEVVASGPTYKDNTTIKDAENIIEKYSLGSFNLVETTKEDKYFEKIYNIPLVSNRDAIRVMMEKSSKLGYKPIELGYDLYDFPEQICKAFLERAKANSVVVAGGEMRLIVPAGRKGKGGRNSYLVLEMISKLRKNQVFVSFASDGIDNGKAAGAIINGEIKKDLKKLMIDENKHKESLDSFTIFEKTDNLIFTGPVEANVSDLMMLLTYDE